MRWYKIQFVLIVCAACLSFGIEEKGSSAKLTLQEALGLAMANHPRILSARDTVRAAEANYGGSFSAYYPQVTGNLSYRRTTSSGTTTTVPLPFDFYAGSINFTQNIYDFGRREGAIEFSFNNLQSAHYTYQTAVNDVLVNAKTAYFGYLQAQNVVRVRAETVRLREQLLSQAKAFLEVGTRPKIDVTNAEANLANARVALIQAENAVRIARVTLANSIGVEELPQEVFDVEGPEAIPFDLNNSKAQALKQRPELLQLQSTVKAQLAQLKVDKAANYPSINLSADYGRRGRTSGPGSREFVDFNTPVEAGKPVPKFEVENERSAFPLAINWSVNVSMSIPIFTGFQTSYKIQETQARVRSLESQEEERRQQVLLEVEQAYLRMEEARARIEAAEKGVAAAKENLDLATGRYQVGVGSILEITDAQVLHVDAQTTYIQANTDLKVAEAELVRAIGAWPL